MGLTRVSGDILQTPLNVGVVTATEVNVGSAVTIHTGGFQVGSSDIHSTGISVSNINSSGVITATSFSGNITGNLTGDVNSSGVSTFTTLKVGTAVTISSGIISATSFYGDGTNLTNTGSTLSAAEGSQRVVLTGQTSGTMTASATDSALTYAQSTGTLSATKFSGDGSALTGIAATTDVRTNSLVVSGVSTFAVGSASTPSISPTEDSNTGIFFPAADTIAGATAGTERFRVTPSGYFSYNSAGTPTDLFYIYGYGSGTSFTADYGVPNTDTYYTGLRVNHPGRGYNTSGRSIGIFGQAIGTGIAVQSVIGVCGYGVDQVGNSGCIGVFGSTPPTTYSSNGPSAGVYGKRPGGGVSTGYGYGVWGRTGSSLYGTNFAMSAWVDVATAGHTAPEGILIYDATTSGTKVAIRFQRAGSYVGSVTSTTSSVAYNTSSDYRLKENIIPLTNAINRLKQIPVRRFNFISDPDKTVDGFIAHEVSPFVPESVTGEKDGMQKVPVIDENNQPVLNEDGTQVLKDEPVYQGIDQAKLVPLLTAALQEAVAEIETLKARLDAAGL